MKKSFSFRIVKLFIFFCVLYFIGFTKYAFSQNTFAYVANVKSHDVSVINIETDDVVATIPVGQNPFGVIARFDGRYVFVTNAGSNSISVINTLTNTVDRTILVGSSPVEMVFSPDGKHLYVTVAASDDIYKIDAYSFTVIDTISASSGDSDTSSGIAITPEGDRLYVVNSDTSISGVIVIDLQTRTVIKEVPVGDGATGISINSTGTKAYVCNSFDNTISVLDLKTNSVIKTLTSADGVGVGPTFVKINPDNKAWVTFSLSGRVGIFDVSSDMLVTTFSVGNGPTGIAFSPCDDFTFVVNSGSYSDYLSSGTQTDVWKISTNNYTKVASVDVGKNGRGIDISTVPVTVPTIFDIFVIGEERTDNVFSLQRYGHNVIYGGTNLDALASINLDNFDQVWISSYQGVANLAATEKLIQYVKDGGRVFFMGESYDDNHPSHSAYADWRDDVFDQLGSGGLKQSKTESPTQSIYYTNAVFSMNTEPNTVCQLNHLSLGNGSFENLGNGGSVVTTEQYGLGAPVAVAFDFNGLTNAKNSRAVVYLNSNIGQGWDLYVANIAEFLGKKGMVPVEISTKDGFGVPGGTGKVLIRLKNNQDVAGVQFTLTDSDNHLTADNINPVLRTTGFNLDFSEQSSGEVKVVMYSTSGAVIPSGDGSIAEIEFLVNASAPLGSSADLILSDVVVADPSAKSLYVKSKNGSFQFSYKKGDVNFDGVLDILDVIRISNIILIRPPFPTSAELIAANYNEDANVDVLDIIGTVNEILGGSMTKATFVSNNILDESAVFWLKYENNNVISLQSSLPCPIAGVQFNLELANLDINAVTAKPNDLIANMKVLSHLKDNQLTVIIYSLDGKNIPESVSELVRFEFDQSINNGVEIKNAILGDWQANSIKSVLKNSVSEVIPESFTIYQNYPNPFNPATNIKYYLDHPGDVTIKIFNSLGREIKTFLQQKQKAGFYTIKWNGLDQFGEKASSGIYIYQIKTGDLVLSKKMLLLQ